jgi:hypothetical protein
MKRVGKKDKTNDIMKKSDSDPKTQTQTQTQKRANAMIYRMNECKKASQPAT